MDRRDFLTAAGSGLGLLAAADLFAPRSALAAAGAQAAGAGADGSESAAALEDLRAAIGELEQRFHQPAWRMGGPARLRRGTPDADVPPAPRGRALVRAEPERPVWRRMVTTTKKLFGDNPDAVYYAHLPQPEAPLPDPREHRERDLHLVHGRARRRRRRQPDGTRRDPERHRVRDRTGRQLRDRSRARRSRARQLAAPRPRGRQPLDAPLLRARDEHRRGPAAPHSALDRADGSDGAAAAAERRLRRRGHPARRELPARHDQSARRLDPAKLPPWVSLRAESLSRSRRRTTRTAASASRRSTTSTRWRPSC